MRAAGFSPSAVFILFPVMGPPLTILKMPAFSLRERLCCRAASFRPINRHAPAPGRLVRLKTSEATAIDALVRSIHPAPAGQRWLVWHAVGAAMCAGRS